MQKKIRYSSEQKKIIKHDSGPALVNAGAGTGKSATIIGKIDSLSKQGDRANQILVITYGRNASNAFAMRLYKELGSAANGVCVKTIHAFGLDVIREHYKKLGFTSPPKGIKNNKAASNKKKYIQHKLRYNKVDHHDMQTMPLQLFAEYPAILQKVAGKFSHLMVDELQDIDQPQAKLIELLAKNIPCTLLVGDKKQSINGFRGAGVEHWNYLVKRLSPKQFALTKTFRIPSASLPFVNAVAGSFSDDKSLVSTVDGYKPSLYGFPDPDAQANHIAQEILRLHKNGVELSEIACLSMENVPLQQLKLALEARGIEAVESNYSKSINKWLRMLRALICMTRWTVSQQQFSVPSHSIGHIIKLVSISINEQDWVFNNIVENGISGLKMKRSRSKSKQHFYRLERLRKVRHAITDAAQQADTQAAIQILIDALLWFVRRQDKNCKHQIQRELSRIKLQARGLTWDEIKINNLVLNTSETGVTLSTVHGAKGKEWPYVFLINVTEDEFGKDEYEVMYTAVTRHSWKLYLLETPRQKNTFTKNRKLLHRSFGKESSLIARHVKYLKDYRQKSQ